MKLLDARGFSCPEPVLMTKRALESGGGPLKVTVDNKVAAGNITRFAENRKLRVTLSERGEEYDLLLEG